MSATKQNIYFHPTYTQPKTNQLSSRQYKQALSSNMALLYGGKSKLGSEQTQQKKIDSRSISKNPRAFVSLTVALHMDKTKMRSIAHNQSSL